MTEGEAEEIKVVMDDVPMTFPQKLQKFLDNMHANVRTALIEQASWKEDDDRLVFAQHWTWEKMNPQSFVQPFKKGKMKSWSAVQAQAYTPDGKLTTISVSFH